MKFGTSSIRIQSPTQPATPIVKMQSSNTSDFKQVTTVPCTFLGDGSFIALKSLFPILTINRKNKYGNIKGGGVPDWFIPGVLRLVNSATIIMQLASTNEVRLL